MNVVQLRNLFLGVACIGALASGRVLIVGCGLLFVSAPAFAQLEVRPAPGTELTLVPGTLGPDIWKTPPHRDGDINRLRFEVHNPGTGFAFNWAGTVLKIHLRDATEIDVLGIQLAPDSQFNLITQPPGAALPFDHASPFGPQSNNVSSVPLTVTFWHELASLSGINLPPQSGVQPLIDLTVAAKNTTALNNSDIDLSIMAWNIVHVPNSQNVRLFQSDLAYGTTNQDPRNSEIGGNIAPGDGIWYHITNTQTHLGRRSAYYATIADALNIGIEHVPQPAPISLLAGALLCGVMGGIECRKRRKASRRV